MTPPQQTEQNDEDIHWYLRSLARDVENNSRFSHINRRHHNQAKLEQLRQEIWRERHEHDVINKLISSDRYQKGLLDKLVALRLSRDDAYLRNALNEDFKLQVKVLRELIDNEQQRTVALALQDSHAQFLVDFCQRVLDEDPLRMRKTPHDVPALRAMRKFLVDLSKQSGKLPSRLYIDGVSNKSDFAIDHGGFSDVYTAEYKNLKVALKLLHVAGDASVPIPDQKKTLIREAIAWCQLHHLHVLPLIGLWHNPAAKFPLFVTPWLPEGTVIAFLRRNTNMKIDVQQLVLEIAQGLEYLHSEDVVHGDLRGDNVLIDSGLRVRLTDFGLASLGRAQSTIRTYNGINLNWVAPELYKEGAFERTTATDVFAFAGLCLHVYTLEPPYKGLTATATERLICDGIRPDRPTLDKCHGRELPDYVWSCITQCWDHEVRYRPKMRRISSTLEDNFPAGNSSDPTLLDVHCYQRTLYSVGEVVLRQTGDFRIERLQQDWNSCFQDMAQHGVVESLVTAQYHRGRLLEICTRLSLNQEAREKIQKALFDDEQDMAFVLDTLTNNEEELKRARELQGSKSRLLQDLLQLVLDQNGKHMWNTQESPTSPYRSPRNHIIDLPDSPPTRARSASVLTGRLSISDASDATLSTSAPYNGFQGRDIMAERRHRAQSSADRTQISTVFGGRDFMADRKERVRTNKCHNCGQSGHFKQYCPQKVCTVCGATAHYAYDCEQRTCNTCKERGHSSPDCQVKNRKEPFKIPLPQFNLHQTFNVTNRDPEDYRRGLFALLVVLFQSSSEVPLDFRNPDITIPNENRLIFAPDSRALVTSGTLGSKDIAFKKIKTPCFAVDLSSPKVVEGLLIRRQLSHPNVLPLLCLYTFETEIFGWIMPWLPLGHVSQFMASEAWATTNRDQMLLDVAKGLQYMHAWGVIHGDLRADNVLIQETEGSHRAVLSSLSTSALLQPDHGTSLRWRAPELLSSVDPATFEVTAASDVYAFASLCLEVYTGKEPWAGHDQSHVEFALKFKAKPGRPSAEECGGRGFSNEAWYVLETCWESTPTSRPSADELVATLDTLLGQEDTNVLL